ncbi:unnamed protein product [Rotaria socialis]|uniref:Uncharacterized protein n=1 Tax=Rotaria socialis TaxID=392032 RepID=A0A821SZ15_9BILA|nr:unnamed protein product [Rotaria socialis]CAF4865670.1 unnamed protein product [Rotaria socialis]
MSTTDVKCNFTIDILLEHDFLRDSGKCSSCQQPLGIHRYKNDIEKQIGKLNMGHQNQNADIQKEDNANNEHEPSGIQKRNTSLSPPSSMNWPNILTNLHSNHSDDSDSIKSSASSQASTRIHSGTISEDSQTVKKNQAIARKKKNEVIMQASRQRIFLTQEFLRKHYCSRIGSNNVEELYNRILSVINKDTNRVYHLMKHARHSCYGLIQIIMNDDQLMDLFKFLDTFVP